MMEFEPFPKIGRISRSCIITEKLDGTNAQIAITNRTELQDAFNHEGQKNGAIVVGDILMRVGSRNRFLTLEQDNYGFFKWVQENREALAILGPGRHFGEWWGQGIQRGYGLGEKRFSLFNTGRWTNNNPPPSCCGVVPVVYAGPFTSDAIDKALADLKASGSKAAPGFMDPEGIVVFHSQTRTLFKKTFDDNHKGE